MKLEILSPEGAIYNGEVDRVTLPGTLGSFTVLENHASLISSLEEGDIVFHVMQEKEERTIPIKGGFVEVRKNVVSVCVK